MEDGNIAFIAVTDSNHGITNFAFNTNASFPEKGRDREEVYQELLTISTEEDKKVIINFQR